MKKREIVLIVLTIILFLILIYIFIYSRYNSSQESEGTLNSLSSFLSFIIEPFHLPDPWAPKSKGPYGEPIIIEIELPPGAIDPNAPIPDDLNNPLEPPDRKLPPHIKTNPNQKPTIAAPKIISDYLRKILETIKNLFNWKNN